jgi:hypothetical protein
VHKNPSGNAYGSAEEAAASDTLTLVPSFVVSLGALTLD